MKKTFALSAITTAILTLPVMAEEVAQLEEVSVVESGSMFKMGEVPVHQAKSTVAVSREQLDEQAVKKVDEIARYQAGFTNQVFGADTNTNWFRVRGAEVSQAVNGLPSFSYGFFTPYVESFGLEAIEVTKGADSMTFGAAQSGGLINYVTKRASKDKVGTGEFKTNVGTNNAYGFGADYTGKMNEAESLRYRVVASLNNEDGQWKKTNNKTLYLAPTLEWDISERTRLSLLTSYQKDYGTPSSNFYPTYGTLMATPKGYISRSTNLGDPVNDHEENKQYNLGYELSHDFGNGLRANSSYRYSHIENFHRGAYPFSYMDPTTYDITRGLIYNKGKVISHTLDNRLNWDFKTDWLKNSLVIGTDYRHNKVDTMYDNMGYDFTTFTPATRGTNGFNPQVGWNQPQDISGATHRTIKARQLGFYLQNQARFVDKLVLGLGIRHDRAKQDEYTSTQTVKDNHTSYSGSLMYEAPLGLNPYFSYSESFNVPTGLAGNERLYDPQITRQYELGVKYLPTWLDGVITVAGFRAKDIGALKMNSTGVSTQDDPVYRKGLEVQAEVNLTDNWNGVLAYTYTKSQSKDSTGVKTRKEYVPTNTLSAKTAYTFNNGVLNGLTLGAGIRYVGHSVTSKGSTYSHHRLPSATVVDLMARYKVNANWTAQLNVDNVGDRKYVAACDYYCYYGAERKINASLSYKF